MEGEVARVCSETLLGFEVDGDCDEAEVEDAEAVRFFFSDCAGAEALVCEDEAGVAVVFDD